MTETSTYEELLAAWFSNFPLVALFGVITLFLFTLTKGADLLVDEAVSLSVKAGISKVVIGATLISLGTTLPEVSVSVAAAISGDPELALGNAVGSIICDTGLILGIAAIIGPIPLPPSVVGRQGWIQFGSGVLLVASCLPYSRIETVFTEGGRLPQSMGIVFVVLLIVYLYLSFRWARKDKAVLPKSDLEAVDKGSVALIVLKIAVGIAVVIVSSKILIPAVQETAHRLRIPEGIIAATLVAFGTSLPELFTAISAVRKGHGEIALGNIIGADILNVLSVSGVSAAVTREGLVAPPHFTRIIFPSMLLILLVFRVGIFFSRGNLRKPFGFVLLGIYAAVTALSYGRI